jgi:hypothetical protein
MNHKTRQSLVASFISGILDDSKRLEAARINARTFASEDKRFDKMKFFQMCNVTLPPKDETAVLAKIEAIRNRINTTPPSELSIDELNTQIAQIEQEITQEV